MALKTSRDFLSQLNNRAKLIKFKPRTEAETSVRLEIFHTYTKAGWAREGVIEGRKTIVSFWASPDVTLTMREKGVLEGGCEAPPRSSNLVRSV